MKYKIKKKQEVLFKILDAFEYTVKAFVVTPKMPKNS